MATGLLCGCRKALPGLMWFADRDANPEGMDTVNILSGLPFLSFLPLPSSHLLSLTFWLHPQPWFLTSLSLLSAPDFSALPGPSFYSQSPGFSFLFTVPTLCHLSHSILFLLPISLLTIIITLTNTFYDFLFPLLFLPSLAFLSISVACS